MLRKVVLCAVLALIVAHSAYAEDSRKEYLRLQATEFCAVFKMPPAQWVAGLLKAAEAGDPVAQAVANALLPSFEHYQKLKCGDV